MTYKIRFLLFNPQLIFSFLLDQHCRDTLRLPLLNDLFQGHSVAFHVSRTLSVLGQKRSFILSWRTTAFSLSSHLSYRKAILDGVSEASSAAVWFPLTLL